MENERLFGLICYLQRMLTRKNASIFSEEGVKDVSGVQFHALVAVGKAKFEGRVLCQKDLEKELGLRASSVSSLLVNLEKGGYIVRKQSESDARAKYVVLTKKGESLCERHKHVMDSCDMTVQSSLTEEEAAELKRLIFKIIDSVSEE